MKCISAAFNKHPGPEDVAEVVSVWELTFARTLLLFALLKET